MSTRRHLPREPRLAYTEEVIVMMVRFGSHWTLWQSGLRDLIDSDLIDSDLIDSDGHHPTVSPWRPEKTGVLSRR
jgi:hypothetical protein